MAVSNATNDQLRTTLRQEQSQQVPTSLSIREMDKSSKRASARTQAPGTGGKYQLDDRGITAAQFNPNVFKAAVPDTIMVHKAANPHNVQELQRIQSGGFPSTDERRNEPQPPPMKPKNKVGEYSMRLIISC